MARQKLPNRRMSESREFEMLDMTGHVTVGFNEEGHPREVFILSGKPGSTVDTLLGDAAVIISIAIQNGISPAHLAHSISRMPESPLRPGDLDKANDRKAASVIGAALDWLIELEKINGSFS